MEFKNNADILQAIFDSTPDSVVVMQPTYHSSGQIEDFKILLANPSAHEMIGDSDYKEKLFTIAFSALNGKELFLKFAAVMETGIAANFDTGYTDGGVFKSISVTGEKHHHLLVVTLKNITAQRQSETGLREALDVSEQQKRLYESITNNTPDLLYAFDLDYRFTYANKALLTMWGKTSEEAVGKGLRENGYEEWHALMHEREIDEVVSTKKPVRGTVSFPHAELGRRVYDYIFSPVLNDAGEVEGIAGSTRDITEQKNAGDRILGSEARLKSVIDQTPAPTLTLRTENLVIEQVNKPMLEMIGQGEDIVGRPLIEVLPELEGQYVWEQVQKVFREGIPFDQSEVRVPHNRGGVMEDFYYNLAYRPLIENGEITGMVQVAFDVTAHVVARKQAEESEQDLRNLVLQAPIGICVLDAVSLKSEIVNERFVEIAGKPYENIIGRPYWETFAEAAPYYEQALQGVVDGGEPFYANEVELMLIRNGKEETVFVTFVYEPMISAGVVKKVIVWVLDNSKQVFARQKVEESEKSFRNLSETLEQQVTERTNELERSNADLLQFAHVASHDLREPVRKIKTFTDRLERQQAGKLDPEALRYIDKIHTATERMYSMIEGVLNYSTSDADLHEYEKVDLNEVIDSIRIDLEVRLEMTGAEIHSENLPAVDGAPVLLYQLFYNLINNSIKFVMPGVIPQITISAELVNIDNTSFASIVVADNGIGFGNEFSDRIFETFTRLNSKDKYEGTGLGLALCKKIAERHGGTITAFGDPGHGAKFTILLPVQHSRAKISG